MRVNDVIYDEYFVYTMSAFKNKQTIVSQAMIIREKRASYLTQNKNKIQFMEKYMETLVKFHMRINIILDDHPLFGSYF